jgi:hypothetical protein
MSLVLIESDQINEKIQIILRQTDYTEEIAREKLKEYNYNQVAVIKSYFGIPEKKERIAKSLNQEIYKHLREKFNETKRIL